MEIGVVKGAYADGQIIRFMKIENSLSDFIERLFYEKITYQEVIKTVIEASNKFESPLDSNEKFKILLEQKVEADLAFNIAMEEMKDIFLTENKDLLEVKDNLTIGVDFGSLQVYATYNEKKRCCK